MANLHITESDGWHELDEFHERADEILGSGMRVHRTILPRVVFQIENLINLDRIPSKVKLLALPAKWRSESAPARVLALVE